MILVSSQEKNIEKVKNIFLFESGFFVLAQLLGIFSALRILELFETEKFYSRPPSFWGFIFAVFLASFFIFFLIKFLKLGSRKKIFFKIIFVLTVFLGSFIFFSLWLGDFLALLFLFFLFFFWFKSANILLHNFLLIFALVGLGSVVGLGLEPKMIILALVIFSFYDFVAVYKTKHMVKMARAMIESEAILGLVLPSKVSGFKANLKEIFSKGKFVVLGGGDILFPLILCVSLLSQGTLSSLIVAFFVTIGLAVSFSIFIFQPFLGLGDKRQPIPALPPIAFFSIIGFLLTKLI